MNKHRTYHVLPLLALALVGCDEALLEHDLHPEEDPELFADGRSTPDSLDAAPAQEWGPDGLALPEPEPLAKVLSSTSGFQTFQWKKGTGDVKMGASAEKTCFLAGLNGSFTSLSDLADVGTVNNEWLLRGFGNVAAVTAICISTKFVEPQGPSVWTTQESFMKDLQSTSGIACFLTRMGGKLDGDTSGPQTTGAKILKSPDGKRWIFNIEGNPGSPVQAKTICIKGAFNNKLSVSDEVAWFGGEPSLLLSSGVDVPCLLTQVTGTVASPGDWIGLWLSELQGALRQNLGGNQFTQEPGLVAKTRCINITVGPPVVPPFVMP